MEMLATDYADSCTTSRRYSHLRMETHSSGMGFGAFAAAWMATKRQRRCFIFAAPKVTMPSQTRGIVVGKSVGKIGDKQTSE
jgi:hypothetical protein